MPSSNRASSAVVVCLLALGGCASHQAPYATTLGELPRGATISVHSLRGDVSVFPPKAGEPSDRFTVETTAQSATPPPAPLLRKAETTVLVDAPDAPVSMLVRSPDGVNVRVSAGEGNVNITNITGAVDVHTDKGNVAVMVPSYAQATVGSGNMNVTDGAAAWPGTLHYAVDNGDAVVYVVETARFHLRMHTDNGTLFDDFGLRGTASGNNETIEGDVNGGGSRAIDVEVHNGSIHVLRLSPQA